MTTATLKPPPKRKRGRPAKRRKTMTEQSYPVKTPDTITKVQSHLPDIQLIEREALWNDFQNRLKINNYEVGRAMEDLKNVVEATYKYSTPYVEKLTNKVKELRSQSRLGND